MMGRYWIDMQNPPVALDTHEKAVREVLRLEERADDLDRERREAHVFLTGRFETGWAMCHPDGQPEAELGKAAAALLAEKRRLEAEVARLKRGDFTETEFQALCHHRDERPGCTRADFEAGCREYQRRLFGPAWTKEPPDWPELESVWYWWREGTGREPEVVAIGNRRKDFTVERAGQDRREAALLSKTSGEWCGPISPPE